MYKGNQASEYEVRVSAGGNAFQWKQMDANREKDGAFSSDVALVPYQWLDLGDGVRVRFTAASGYVAGDSWVFTAYTAEEATQRHIAFGSVRPGVVKSVFVSNDGGVSWSKDLTGLTRYFFSDIYVSGSGNDAHGTGSQLEPYKTIQHAVKAALDNPRNGNNKDTVVVQDGRYVGIGNNGLHPLGKSITMKAANFGEAVIDCSGTDNPEFIQAGDRHSKTGSIDLIGVNTENCHNHRSLVR